MEQRVAGGALVAAEKNLSDMQQQLAQAQAEAAAATAAAAAAAVGAGAEPAGSAGSAVASAARVRTLLRAHAAAAHPSLALGGALRLAEACGLLTPAAAPASGGPADAAAVLGCAAVLGTVADGGEGAAAALPCAEAAWLRAVAAHEEEEPEDDEAKGEARSARRRQTELRLWVTPDDAWGCGEGGEGEEGVLARLRRPGGAGAVLATLSLLLPGLALRVDVSGTLQLPAGAGAEQAPWEEGSWAAGGAGADAAPSPPGALRLVGTRVSMGAMRALGGSGSGGGGGAEARWRASWSWDARGAEWSLASS